LLAMLTTARSTGAIEEKEKDPLLAVVVCLPKGHGGAHGWPPPTRVTVPATDPVVAATSALVPLSAVGAASGTTNAIPPVPVVTLPPEPVVTLPPEPVVTLPPEPVVTLPPVPSSPRRSLGQVRRRSRSHPSPRPSKRASPNRPLGA